MNFQNSCACSLQVALYLCVLRLLSLRNCARGKMAVNIIIIMLSQIISTLSDYSNMYLPMQINKIPWFEGDTLFESIFKMRNNCFGGATFSNWREKLHVLLPDVSKSISTLSFLRFHFSINGHVIHLTVDLVPRSLVLSFQLNWVSSDIVCLRIYYLYTKTYLY